MKHLYVNEYHEQQAACDGLCDVTDAVVQEANLMRCVTCPFCQQTVNAILTNTTISCPKCDVTVNRQ